ncbi:MAG: epoxide hydrolase, partial [Actinoplanes sp.]
MKPFHIEIPQATIDDLNRRLADVRWPAPLGDDDWSRGVPVWYLRELVEYWRTQYDWRAAEAELNRYPQFLAEINGATVHFLHVRSPEPDAVPMLITHGWPGSVAEFVDVIGPLTDPAAHGGDRADAFHLVLASPPGFGFSGPARPGWHAGTIAPVWAELMNQLGYDQYVVQGGDAGSVISQQVAAVAPDHVIGLHVNMLMTFPSGDPEELAGLSEVDQARLALMGRF